MKALKSRAIEAAHRLHAPLRRPAVRMAVRIEHREHCLHRLRRRAVFVLPNGVQQLPLARGDFVGRELRLHHHLAEQVQHRLEIFGQAGAAHGQRVPVRAEAQRHAARVERFGDLVAAPPCRAAIERSRRQVAQSQLIVRFVDAAGVQRHLERDRRHRARFLRKDDGAVLQDNAACRKPASHRRRHDAPPAVGLNQPTVR